MTHINQRRDYSTVWTEANPILQDGEIGWEKDTRKSKLGDGVTHWNDLGYTISGNIATKADVGLGSVDNTSDMDKPVSTAQKNYTDAGDAALNASKADAAATTAALATKAPLASPTFTGDPKAPTPPTTDNDTSLATTAFVQANAVVSRAKPWNPTVAYSVGDVVGYAGGIYRCKAAPTTGVPPALHTTAWDAATAPLYDGWYAPDPYLVGDTLASVWQTFWKTGTVNSVVYSTTAGDFETGPRGIKVDMAAASSQRLYPLNYENIVRGGEVIQVQVRAKYTTGVAGQTRLGADFFQSSNGQPAPFGGGDSAATAGMEGTYQNLTNAWATYTFTFVAVNGKPRGNATVFPDSGSAAAVVNIDWIKVTRKPELFGMVAGSRAPNVWHSVGAAGEPAFANAWSNYDVTGAAQRSLQFRRDGNEVVLRGIGKAGTYGAPTFNLPVGYRPDTRQVNDTHFPSIQSDALCRISVNGNGDVIVNAGVAGGWVAFDAVRFKVAGA